MSDGLRAILDGNKYCPSDAEVDEWRKLTLDMAAIMATSLPIIDAHRRYALGEGDLTAAAIRSVLADLGNVA